MRKLITLLALLGAVSGVSAQQKRIGDYIESTSYNLDKIGVERSQQYHPHHGNFVSQDGVNRYTRALYGSYTDWRLETSDRPIFAVVKKGHHRNIRFVFLKDGVEYPLEQTEHCRSLYGSGRREYLLTDSRWGEAKLRIEVLATTDGEKAVWRVASPKMNGRLRVVVCNIAQPKLHRNGDIGADKPGCLEPAGEPLQTVEADFGRGVTAYFEVDVDQISVVDAETGRRDYQQARNHYRELSRRISFQTPDPYVNALAGALVLAADGDWDGKTWLHGCVGWRMPLAGWRAAYVGDVLGWHDRQRSHFDAYAKSQVNKVPATLPHPTQDPGQQMARAEKRWGTQMYSDGYICRNPERNDQMHHYDMNLNYIDELLWHFQYDADTAYMRRMWPVIKSHLAWEKRNYDSDGDHLYDAYCCIWASDALYYSGGAVTHSSAYNYRGNRLAARIAEIIGEDPQPYRREAEAILQAMNSRLWLQEKGVWAEYQDAMGLRRTHDHPAVWSIYTPIDCGACTQEQAYQATQYVDRCLPHIPVEKTGYQTIATSDWLPYSWSINNVAAAEVMHTALAFFEAGRSEAAYQLMMGNIMDQMYYGQSPANFGQISYYDAARGECYRDFGDCIGISSRTLLQGLFGIVPQALDGFCLLRPGFPQSWDSARVATPYLEYRFTRRNGIDRYEVTQHFRQPLRIVLRQNLGQGRYRDIEGTAEEHQVIEVPTPNNIEPTVNPEPAVASAHPELAEPDAQATYWPQAIDKYFNANVADIFRQEYRSPRPQTTTLQIPLQGIGEWCHPHYVPDINDSVFRSLIADGRFTVAGVPFRTPSQGRNIVYASLWDNYPNSVTVPLSGRASQAWLLMAGSTNHMQCRIDNGLVVAHYKDGTSDTLRLVNPDNWCPIEQDFYVDGKAFQTVQPRPYRVCLGTGTVSRDLGSALSIQGVYGREIPGGAATMLCMPLDRRKSLRSLSVHVLSNDVVIGLMGVTLQP